ncbi:TPA: hypothetical protein ACNVSH_004116 [Klebsiella aerogenes]|uniref:hypothetical protein n=1 Tax=Klebsiella aerogenes TaxID=548 RepID=UPI0004A00606|nr:hypothetical protein [Klebsiella aerogenes]KDF32837.1 hypothetical protein AE04_02328 [Klebsiella aerogenes MGH 78]KZQ59544.1 hypothetical protein A3N61_01030 [Klebsiella aerogenes]MDX7654524.1 hypothetical protein [Klebsiella aerogenes]HBV6025094.1 hypothetical protein [Klebsiella aerogenes]HBZ8413078.1 hypothetical protein [Klebsiella aerogenes]
MSLEQNLELNNQLLTKQNSLYERNIALLERLVQSLASGVALKPDTLAQVQEYRETVTESKTALTLDDLQFGDVIALAAFYPVPQQITEDMLQRAIDYRDAEADARVVKIDALDSALQGVKRAKSLLKPALLDLSRNVLKYWDDLPTIGERRSFAERLLDAAPTERDAVKPKKASGKGNQERKGPFYWNHPESGAIGSVEDFGALNELLEDGLTVEINKVEFLQLQEAAAKNKAQTEDSAPDFDALRKQAEECIKTLCKGGYRAEAVGILDSFGAKKLGEVEDKDLADLIAKAEKALEG